MPHSIVTGLVFYYIQLTKLFQVLILKTCFMRKLIYLLFALFSSNALSIKLFARYNSKFKIQNLK